MLIPQLEVQEQDLAKEWDGMRETDGCWSSPQQKDQAEVIVSQPAELEMVPPQQGACGAEL